MPPKSAAARENSISLHIAPSFPSAWQTIVLPWFQATALASLASNEPAVVVTPSPSAAAFLRSRLLEHKIPLLGVRFLTPPRLRELLLADTAALAPLREHLRLLLAIAAESTAIANQDDVDRAAIARSISHAPDNLLRVFDEVSTAGGNFESMGPPAACEIIKIFQDLVRSCHFKLVHEADRAVMETAKTGPAQFDQLLLFGFTAEHWPLWTLLRSAALSARHTTVVLEYPREQTRAADESWIGTWEEKFQPAKPIADQNERARPSGDLIQPEIAEVGSRRREQVHFLVGLNATEQAQAITALALKFLAEDACTRLGVLFPRNGALPRLVSELLIRAGVPHSDGIGHLSPGEFEAPAWDAWLDLQENHQLEPTLRFLESNPESLGSLSIHNVRDKLRRAYRDILIDDIHILREYCSRRTEHEHLIQIAKLL